MDNLNDKLSNEAQTQPSCLGAVMHWYGLLTNKQIQKMQKIFGSKKSVIFVL